MSRLSVEGLFKSYGATPVLRGVSFDAGEGNFVVVVGPSGSGKTTVLRCLAGLEAVDEGHIRLGSTDITDLTPAARNIAMVFQNYALYPTKTVRQNMSFGLRQHKTPRDETKRLVDEAAKTLGIPHLMDRRPSQLSGGQRQRVAIGRAMVRKPTLFLFDEPLSNLDAALRGNLRLEIKRIHNSMGVTSVYVTHDQHEAMSLADLLIVMKDGRIEQMGPPDQVFRKPESRFVASFIGSPAMEFLPTEVTNGMLALPGGLTLDVRQARQLAEGTLLDLGVRPDDLEIVSPDTDQGLAAEVDVIQELGTTRLINVRSEAGSLNISQPSDHPRPSGRVRVGFRANRVMLFDRATGLRIE